MLNDVHSQIADAFAIWKPSSSYTALGIPQSCCSCRQKTRKSFQYRCWMYYISEETYRHRLTCPYSAHLDYSRSVAMHMTICNGLLSFCVQAGLKRSRRGGWNSIAPVLRYRAVVPRGTGAFKVLRDAQNAMWFSRMHSQEQRTDILMNATTSLQRSFQTSASPYDVDEDGHDLLSVCPSRSEHDCFADGDSMPYIYFHAL